jgi:hypothetical protein
VGETLPKQAMTDSEIISAVLKACGWKQNAYCWFKGNHFWHEDDGVPDILTSLDACHSVLPMKKTAFQDFVWFNFCKKDWRALWHMPAREWCIAFIKWKQLLD